MLYVSQAWSSGGGVDRTPRTKASNDVVGADGVGAGGGTGAVAAGADTEALASEIGTAADFGPHGTRLKASVVAFPLLSSPLLPPEAAQLQSESQSPSDQDHRILFPQSSPGSPDSESGWPSPSQSSV